MCYLSAWPRKVTISLSETPSGTAAFPTTVTCFSYCSDHSSFEKEGLILPRVLRSGPLWQLELVAAGVRGSWSLWQLATLHLSSGNRDGCWYSTSFSSSFLTGCQPTGQNHPHLEWYFLFQLTYGELPHRHGQRYVS